MSQRVIQNSFVGGEISPEIYGRQDLKAYYQGAAKIRNFCVRRTGGIRKRAGTSFMLHGDAGDSAWFRAIPFMYDRYTFCILLLWCQKDETKLRYQLHKHGEDGDTSGDPAFTNVTQISSEDDLENIRFKQFGDTLFFTDRGRHSFKAEIFIDEMRVEFEEISPDIVVRNAPSLTSVAAGFRTDTDKGYVVSSRKYALYGVKNGVLSKPTEKEVTIYLVWIAGATVTLTFTPEWQNHDYYILGKLFGANYGTLSTFYPNLQTANVADGTFANSGVSATGTVGAMGYTAGGASISALWKLSPDNLTTVAVDSTFDSETSYHTNSSFVTGELTVTANNSAPVLGMKLWVGAKLRQTGALTTIDAVGVTGDTTVTLKDAAGTTIATWPVNAIYGESPLSLTVENPVVTETNVYKITISNSSFSSIPIRGIALVSDTTTQTFLDNNIVGTDIAGLQERLTVGDSGMDCGLCDIWEQRLVFASSRNNPFSMWFSTVGNIYNFYAYRPQTMADAFSVTIPPTSASKILHICASKWLLVFTESGEYICDGASEGFGYATISIKRTSGVGAHERIEPILTENHALFVASDSRSVYEMRYDLSQDNVVPVDRSAVANHLTESARIVKIAYQRYPDSVLWCLLSDGTLISMTYMPDQEIIAWARHDFGPSSLVLKDIFCTGSLSRADGYETTSELVLVWECPDDDTGIWLERMKPHVAQNSPLADDAATFDHDEYVEADYPNSVDPQSRVDAVLVTLRPESPDFDAIALRKNVRECALRLRRSGAVSIKPFGTGLNAEPGNVVQAAENGTVALYTGDVKILPRSFHNDDAQLEIASSDDFPCEIQNILFKIDIGEAAGNE